MNPVHYFKGEFVEKERIHISVDNVGFLRGYGVFEFFKAHGKLQQPRPATTPELRSSTHTAQQFVSFFKKRAVSQSIVGKFNALTPEITLAFFKKVMFLKYGHIN